MYTGPHTVTDGLMIGYDADDRDRFYLGEPTTNLLYWSQDFSNAVWNNRALIVDTGYLAPDGTYTAQRASNPANDSMLYKSGGAVTGQRKSIYARTVSGEGSTYVCGYGGLPQYLANLTEEWQRFDADSLTTETGGTHFYAIDFRQGTLSEALLWGAQKEDKDHATQYIMSDAALGVRTNIDNLLDLVGTTTLVTTAISYDSNAQLVYDGVNDNINLGHANYPVTWDDQWSIEVVMMVPTGANWLGDPYGTIIGKGSYAGSLGLVRDGAEGRLRIWSRGDLIFSRTATVSRDEYHHVVGTWENGVNMALYVDGKLMSSAVYTQTGNTYSPDQTVWYSGRALAYSGSTGTYYEGYLPVAKIYTKALTATEVSNNYNAYKQRFGI